MNAIYLEPKNFEALASTLQHAKDAKGNHMPVGQVKSTFTDVRIAIGNVVFIAMGVEPL